MRVCARSHAVKIKVARFYWRKYARLTRNEMSVTPPILFAPAKIFCLARNKRLRDLVCKISALSLTIVTCRNRECCQCVFLRESRIASKISAEYYSGCAASCRVRHFLQRLRGRSTLCPRLNLDFAIGSRWAP